jgi:hypothetical protein
MEKGGPDIRGHFLIRFYCFLEESFVRLESVWLPVTGGVVVVLAGSWMVAFTESIRVAVAVSDLDSSPVEPFPPQYMNTQSNTNARNM